MVAGGRVRALAVVTAPIKGTLAHYKERSTLRAAKKSFSTKSLCRLFCSNNVGEKRAVRGPNRLHAAAHGLFVIM